MPGQSGITLIISGTSVGSSLGIAVFSQVWRGSWALRSRGHVQGGASLGSGFGLLSSILLSSHLGITVIVGIPQWIGSGDLLVSLL